MSASSAVSTPPQSSKGPWQLPTAGIGGLPTTSLDAPITSVFLVLFVIAAISHMTILQVNLRRGKKFIMSGMLFGFCMARITAATLRLVWSTHQHKIPIAIAANIFMAAGVLLLFIINLIFTQRVIRATHPHLGWAKTFSMAFKIYYATIVVMLIALITATVQSFYTLNPNTRRIDRDIQLVGTVYFTVASFLPIPMLLTSMLLPTRTHVDKFGAGRFRTKIHILLFSSALLTFGAAFRAGVNFVPRPLAHPAWYHSKAVFYCINFLIEIIVVALYAIMRVDKRFIVPNGARGPGSYNVSSEAKAAEENSAEERSVEAKKGEPVRGEAESERTITIGDRIGDEEDFFDGLEEVETHVQKKDVETGVATH